MARYPEFKDLSTEAQEFVESRKISGRRTIDQWYQFFHPIAMFDKGSDSWRKKGDYIKGFWAFWIGFGVFMFFLFMFNDLDPVLFLIPAAVILVAGAIQLMLVRYYDKFEQRDIPNLLRGFVVPFLETLKKRFGDDSELQLALDLSRIHEMESEEVKHRTTDQVTYISASVDLPDSMKWKADFDGMGVEVPFYEHYKLRHLINLSMTAPASSYSPKEGENDIQVTESGNEVIIAHNYEEQSDFPIDSDPGPNIFHFRESMGSIRSMLKKSA